MSIQTEKALAEALKKLLTSKTLDKITVRDITDECGVNRQTFYYHFQDVYDLVEWIFKESAKSFMPEGINGGNWQKIIICLIEKLLQEKSFVMNTYYSLTRRQLDMFLQTSIRVAMDNLISESSKGMRISKENLDFIREMSIYALTGVFTEWIGSGMRNDSFMDPDKLFVLMDGMLIEALEKFDEKKE